MYSLSIKILQQEKHTSFSWSIRYYEKESIAVIHFWFSGLNVWRIFWGIRWILPKPKMYMSSLLHASAIFHINCLLRTSHMYACMSWFCAFSSNMFIYAIFAVWPTAACQARRVKASYAFAEKAKLWAEIKALKNHVHTTRKETVLFAVQFHGQQGAKYIYFWTWRRIMG